MRVLPVDDNEAVRKMLRRILERNTSFNVVADHLPERRVSRSPLS